LAQLALFAWGEQSRGRARDLRDDILTSRVEIGGGRSAVEHCRGGTRRTKAGGRVRCA
jgi:hypothetical protein